MLTWIACVLLAAHRAQAAREVLSTIVYTNHGDRIPLITDDYHRLTPLGAQQLFNAGARLRTQYIAPPPNTTEEQSQTWRLSPTLLDGEQVTILTTREAYNVASAQAFMQGLYPPLAVNGTPAYIDSSFLDANNNVVTGPLNGMQFPNLFTSSDQQVNSMYLKGATNCPMFTNRLLSYLNSTEYSTIQQESSDFYQNLSEQYLSNITSPEVIMGYANAWAIYDYLNYKVTHDSNVAESLALQDLAKARILATDWVFALYANTTESGKVGDDPLDAIAGRTLASLVVRLFANSVLNEGTTNKVNLLFGDYIGMVSFAALARLMVPQHAQFFNLPAPGSSYIFELSALVPETTNGTDYPSSTDMYVRFFYTNGTDEYATTVEYPLFGASPSQATMPLSDFVSSMNGIAIGNRTDWCNTCHSNAIFCMADRAAEEMNAPTHHGLSPAVAGVIGALVALVFALLVLGLAMLIGGVRLCRVQTKRRSELGGFKGAEKLASDQDLTLPKGGAGAVVTESSTQDARGHERVGSWELREQAKKKDLEIGSHGQVVGGTIIRRSSFDDDDIHVNPFGDPVRPRDSV